jgi:hypothetical protein
MQPSKGVNIHMKIGQFSDSFLPIVDGVGRVVYPTLGALPLRGRMLCHPPIRTPISRLISFELVDFAPRASAAKQYRTGIPQIDGLYARASGYSVGIIHASTIYRGLEAQRLARRRGIPSSAVPLVAITTILFN